MSTYIVRARSDGRGGMKPFGSYSKAQKGAYVTIGDTKIQVTSDGRVNIPKSVMDKYGTVGSDGRKRIGITFSSSGGKEGWKNVKALVYKPPERAKDQKQGSILTQPPAAGGVLKPSDGQDFSWSI